MNKHTGDNRPSRDSNKSREQDKKLDCIVNLLLATHRKLDRLLAKQGEMMVTLQDLESRVAENTSVDQSAVVLLQGLTTRIQQLIDQGANPAKLQQLHDELANSTADLAAAVASNTPGEPSHE